MNSMLRMLSAGLLALAFPAAAQTFSSGSTGVYGPINVTADTTLDLPPDGIFNCTTINVASGRTLRFRRNAANTPVHLLATGNVTIGGTINVSGAQGNNVIGGLGGAGGFDGGSPGSVGVQPGAGYGPGGGRGGAGNVTAEGAGGGSHATVSTLGSSTNKGAPYGYSLAIPLVGGSGGGGTVGTPGGGGGGGGGAILIASNTRIDLPGRIEAGGGNNIASGVYNGGSGGMIRLVAPVVAGNGTLETRGAIGGGLGRIRVDATDRTQMNFTFFDTSTTSIGSLLLVFPTPLPRLDIVEAAGTTIPLGSGPVSLLLPFGSSPNRTIKIQAKDFNASVPVTLVLTPDHGAPLAYTTTINNTAANNPAVASVEVLLPVNEQITVHAFTK